ncbi:DNA polymerase V [Herbaspirillum sp. Sphag1AN]|uniref:LexA family protein n=1 Tax=unclassified Herbaspirillum TaxID=2624150 RepID=UPI00160D9560|nr:MULTISPECIES: translesion error-prone DNA polymerase V autoproteolytic subunit [unclassified Herbaspirillum]MBB3212672.1 DNA polymerase V [Herbaspirillum sp. Sphag1AN]MBB3245869.1 DNA polymerase V [Herbaspirillum sp. Sphag64]
MEIFLSSALAQLGCEQFPIPAALFSNADTLPLHIIHKISAGFPSPAADYTAEPLDLNKYLIERAAATFLFTVTGDSMNGAGIFDGDKVAVDRSLPPRHGDIVIAVVNNEFTIKWLYTVRDVIELRPDNPAFSTITFKDGEEMQVWGVVVGVVRKVLHGR